MSNVRRRMDELMDLEALELELRRLSRVGWKVTILPFSAGVQMEQQTGVKIHTREPYVFDALARAIAENEELDRRSKAENEELDRIHALEDGRRG